MAKARTAAHLAWSRMLGVRLREWMDSEGITNLKLATALNYASISNLNYNIKGGVSDEFAQRLATAYPDQWGDLPAELRRVLLDDTPRPAMRPELIEATHKIKAGMALVLAGIEALETAQNGTTEGEHCESEDGTCGSYKDDPGRQ